MANTTYPEVDFKFRRGTLNGYKTASYMEGSLNFVKDDESLYIHKDGITFRISDLVLDAGTEDNIRSITLPKAKIYLSSDTHRFMWFDRENLEWTYAECGKAIEADKASKDANGNVINVYYYPREEALADFQTISDMVNAITEDIGLIVGFETVICDSILDLPEEGKKGTIYLVPKTSYYGDDYDPGEDREKDVFVELLFISSDDYGNFYEVIGTTNIDISEFYTKEEVNALLDQYKQTVNASIASFETSMQSSFDAFRGTVNTQISGINNSLSTISNTVSQYANSISDHESRITDLESRVAALEAAIGTSGGSGTSLTTRISTLETDLSGLSTTVSTNKTETDATIAQNYADLNSSIGAVNTNINSLINRATSNEATIDNHTTRLGTVENVASNIENNYAIAEQGDEED